MRELPMLLNGEMVRATMEGRKVMTRRPVKPQPDYTNCSDPFHHADGVWWWPRCIHLDKQPVTVHRNPLGVPGDLLYVREACRAEELPNGRDGVRYLADDAFIEIENSQEAGDRWLDLYHYRGGEGLTVPSIHMPKKYARTWVRNTDVRVERIQDIDVDGAVAEGIPFYRGQDDSREREVGQFAALWDSIYEKRGLGWDANPWEFTTSYEVIER